MKEPTTISNSLLGSKGTRSTLTGLTLSSIFITCFLFLLCDQSIQFGFQPKLITRFCYNSPNLSTVNSQCVLCNYYMFDSALLGCTGSTALNVNITTGQAFCVISQCLGQIRQSPVFLGRRKRELDDRETNNLNSGLDLNQVGSVKSSATNSTTGKLYSIAKEVEVDVIDYQPFNSNNAMDQEEEEEKEYLN